MPPRILLFLLLLSTSLSAQTPAPVQVPAPAQRYLDILTKRPQPGTIYERFYAAWLEESSAAELGQYLDSKSRLPAATAADHLLLAIYHAHRGDDHAALSSYKLALDLNPANASAWIERSRLEARSIDFASALKSLDEALKAKPDAASSVEIGKLRGRALLRLGQNVAALRTWNDLATSRPDDEDLAEEVIDLLTDEGQYDSALDAAQTLIKRTRDPVSKALRQLRLTDILLLAERRDEALKTLRETLAATGSDTWIEGDVLGRISRVFRMGDDVEGLEKFLAALVKENPQRVALAWQHTRLLAESGQKDAALSQARALLQSNPGRRDLQEGFLDLLESLDLIKEAVGQAQSLAQQNTADKELLVRLASLQHRAKEEAAAQSTLQRFLQTAGTTEADHLRVARLLENWEEPPVQPGSPAALAYASAVEKYPASIGAQEAQAHYLHRVGQRDAALAIWTRLARSAALEDLLRITQALQARQESRTALDLLLPREKDFANESRFFALLVQLGLANKELDRTLPWARTRLRLAQDAEGIETAVKDILLVLRSDAENKLSAPLLQELQASATLPIQQRCLLATLLETAGKRADAEKALNAAPPEDKLIALSQLAQLQQFRQEWDKAAQTLQQVIDLPGARTTSRVQRIVDFYRRAEKPELALTWTAEWKKLSPSAVQPWLDESRLLLTLSRTKESLALLRSAMRKFPDNIELASSYATRCLENGQPEEAEQTYLSLYEKTTDSAARLRLIGPLALAAQQHNTLPRLIENFQQRQKQNRASAQPWLALAEIHRATSNDEERRRCLYEASRLRPQDLALLLDIAHSEEEIGLTAEALRTLDSAAKLDKTTKTRENIARLQIESGDADLGYRILFELAGGSQMDARALEQMADTLAEKGEWERVIAFLEPVLEKHPTDYRLHYLNAVALEESGREKEAARAFIEIVGMHEELPGVQSTGRSIGLRRNYGGISLPPGTEDWLVMPSMAQAAYIHRQKQGGRGNYRASNTFGSSATNGLPSNGFVQQAPGVTESPVLALAHVLQLVSMWDVAEREPVLRSLKQAGVNDAALLLAAAEASPQLAITPEMLADQPQNLGLHAAWLLQYRSGDPEELLPLCENCFKLFQKPYPLLAMRTASLAWRIAGDQSATWVQRIIDSCQSLPKTGGSERQVLLSMLRSQSGMFPQQETSLSLPKLDAKQLGAIKDILKRWVLTAEELQGYNVSEEIYAFASVKDWDAVVEIIRHHLTLPDSTQSQSSTVGSSASFGFSRNRLNRFQAAPLPMPSAMTKLTPGMLSWVSLLSQTQRSEETSFTEQQLAWNKEFRAGLKPYMDKAGEPALKLVLRLMLDEHQALLDELAPRLADNPSLDELLFAGWLCQQLNLSEKALAHFQLAQVLVTDPAVMQQLDLAMLYHALRLQQHSDKAGFKKLASTVKPVIERMAQAAATPDEKFEVSQVMNSFGMQEEAQKMGQAARGGAGGPASPNTAVITNPYSRNYSYRQKQQKRVSVDDLLKKGDKPAAVQEIVKQLRTAIQGCLNPQNSSHAHYQIHSVIKLFEQHKLTDEVMQAMQTAAGTGWKTQQEYAVLLEHTGLQTAPAIAAHRAVITANPRAFASHERLASLLATEGDFTAALQSWNTLPAVTQALYLPVLIHELSERSDISVPRPAALSGLLSAWLRSLPAGRPLPANITQQFSQALNSIQGSDSGQNMSFPALWEPYSREISRNGRRWTFNDDGTLKLSLQSQKARDVRRAAQDELCQAMMLHPELALMGFAPLAGLAMSENSRLDETEKIALDLLSQRSMPKIRRRLMTQGYGQQYSGAADPVSVFGAMFATPERIAMPVPAVFATYSAALRGDQRLLDEVIFPAILKAEGKNVAEYCRAYAALLTADETHFLAAAQAWLKPNGTNRSQQQGGPLQEIVRLWQARNIKEPLNPLFLNQAPKGMGIQYAYVPPMLNVYAFALGQRDPEALRHFVRTLRDQWIGATPELRAQNIATWRESQKQRRSRVPFQSSPGQRAVESYVQWLQNFLQDRRGLPLLPLVTEDDLASSPEWLGQIASRYINNDSTYAVEDFMQTADALGFLGESASFRTYILDEGERTSTWFGGLVRHYREHWNDETLNSALIQLGRRKPTLGAHLMQALMLKNSRTPLQLDGKPVPLEITQSSLRTAAIHFVLKSHEQDIADLSATGQGELSALLRTELEGYPQPGQLGEELTRILAPLIKVENAKLLAKVDQVLAAKTWSDLGQQEYQFSQQFPLLLRDLAQLDSAKAEAALRHAIDLLHTSPDLRQSQLQNNSENPISRFFQELAKSPQLLHTILDLADKEGLTQSLNWNSNVASHLEDLLRNPTQVPSLFSGTPWVADTLDFRDLRFENPHQPTLTARLIIQIESRQDVRTAVLSHLAKQPATFGTELLQAFLHRAPGENDSLNSFYNSKRPDDSAIRAFIQKRHADFSKLRLDAATCLLALLKARISNLAQDTTLTEALHPLVTADSAQFEADIRRWMQTTRLSIPTYDIGHHCRPLLDRLAQLDKPRAVALLDQVSKLIAQEESMNSRGGQRRPSGETQVAQWLRTAAHVPELFGEIMQRAEECGAARDAEWLSSVLRDAGNIHSSSPQRILALLESSGMLNPATTFNLHPLPQNKQDHCMLDFMAEAFGVNANAHRELAALLESRHPASFGRDLILMLINYTKADPTAFARQYADEIGACSITQQQLLATFFEHRKWTEAFAANVPALTDEFAPLMEKIHAARDAFAKKQKAQAQVFYDAFLKTTKWEEIEGLYAKSRIPQNRSEPRQNMRPPGSYYPSQSNPAIDYLGDELLLLALASPGEAREALQHLSKIYLSQFPPENYSQFRTPVLDSLYTKLCSSPHLAPDTLKLATSTGQAGVIVRSSSPRSWSESSLISQVFPPTTLASAEKTVSALEQMGLLVGAAEYDPVPLKGISRPSLLDLVADKLSTLKDPVRGQTVLLLTQKQDAPFGAVLLAALLTASDSGNNEHLDRCAAQFAQVRREASGAILRAFSTTFPALDKSEQTAPARFAPLFKLRNAEELAYLQALPAEKPGVPVPFRGDATVVALEITRLMQDGKSDEAVNLVRALRFQLEPTDAEVNFGKGPYRRNGDKLSDFLRYPKTVAGEKAALIACLFQAAARLPEVRMLSDYKVQPLDFSTAEVVHREWERQCGHAAPVPVFETFVQDLAKLAPLDNTAGLWLPQLHDLLVRINPQEQRELGDWMAKHDAADLKVVAEEFKLAQALIDATQPQEVSPRSARFPASGEKALAPAAKEIAALLQNAKIQPHVRLALAAFLTATYPGLLDQETHQAWGEAAAEAWSKGAPITRFELETLLNAAAVLPMTDAWRRTSDLVLQRWQQREEIIKAEKSRYIESSMHPFLMRFAARSGAESVLVQLLKPAYEDIRQSTGILLESNAWQHACEDRLLSATQPAIGYSREQRGWLPPAAETLKNMQSAPLENTLLAEILALDIPEDATRALFPQQRISSRSQRFEAFAKKLAALPLPANAADRAQTLISLGLEHTPGAMAALPQYEALGKTLMANSFKEGSRSILYTNFLAIHAALKMAAGDFSTADKNLQRLKSDAVVLQQSGPNLDSVETNYRNTLFFCLTQLWQEGLAREPAKIAQLALLNGPSSVSYNDKLSMDLLKFAMDAWQAELAGKPPAMPDNASKMQLSDGRTNIISLAAAIAGSGKHRMPFQQRLRFFARIFHETYLLDNITNTLDMLLLEHYFDEDELVRHRAEVLTAMQKFPTFQMNAMAVFMRRHGAHSEAATLWENAAKQSTGSTSGATFYLARWLQERAGSLIRLKKYDDARKCLEAPEAQDKTMSNVLRREALLKLLSQLAPAPAK